MSEVILETKNLTKTYSQGGNPVHALRGVNLQLCRGDFACIMGPSGSGKSTLLHLIGALDRPSSGEVYLENQRVDQYTDQELSRFRRRKLGFIFQFFNLMPTMTAIENVSLPLLLDGVSFQEIQPKALELLKMIGLEKRHDHRPHQLSGGEMQRVAIARALVSDPALILADEPTGNLDSKTGQAVLKLLQNLTKEAGHSILMVTHDRHAASFGNRLIKMKDGQVESDTQNSSHEEFSGVQAPADIES